MARRPVVPVAPTTSIDDEGEVGDDILFSPARQSPNDTNNNITTAAISIAM